MNSAYHHTDMSQRTPLSGAASSGYSSAVPSMHAYQQHQHQHQPPHPHAPPQHPHSSHPPLPPPPPSQHQQHSHHQPSHQHPPPPHHHQQLPPHQQHPQHAQQSHQQPLPPYASYQQSHPGQHALPPHPQAHGPSRPDEAPPPTGPPTDHHTLAQQSTTLSKVEEDSGCKYSLEVHQQPRRARMCGFGDKDRRPITPPPCVRLVIIDPATGKEIDYNEIDHSMFVLSVDLWNEEGTQEVNLVRPSTGANSISSSTAYSYPPLASPEPPAYTFRQPSIPSPARDSAYGQSQGMGYAQDYPSQPGYGHGPTTPSYPPSGSYGPPTQYYPQHGGYRPESSVSSMQNSGSISSYRPSYAQDQGSLTRMAVVGGQPQGMFTRNLIGSLAASAFRLCDTEDRVGIWFVLQDLSVRTEGPFRLRFSFVNVGRTLGNEGRGSNLNQGRAPILSSCFSEVFNVYSAKKFPGVCESTSLSKTFAAQGIKIPIRKDSNMKGGDGGDDDYE